MNFTIPRQEQLARTMAISRQSENLVRAIEQIDQTAYGNILDRCLLEQDAEMHFEQSTVEASINAVQRQRLAADEKQRLDDLKEMQRQKVNDEKRRQQIRETNHDLLDLERKLRAAYVGKGIRNQLAEKEAVRLQEKLDVQREQNRMQKLTAEDNALLLEKRKQEKSAKLQLRQELQTQMDTKKHQHQVLYKEFLQEKKQLDDIVRQIYDEQLAELQEKLANRKRFCADLEAIQRAQKLWQEQERRETEEENRRIVQYLKERDAKLDAEQVKDRTRKQQANVLAERMCAELDDIEKKAREREELLLMLKVEELQEQVELDDRAALERKFRLRLATRLKQDEQRHENMMRQLQSQDDDRQFRAEQLQRLAERDRIEQMTAERRRQKIAEHHRCVRAEMEQRKERREREIVELMQTHHNEMKENEKLQKIIEEERIKLLKEHAGELIGFFPPGILRQSDYAALKIK